MKTCNEYSTRLLAKKKHQAEKFFFLTILISTSYQILGEHMSLQWIGQKNAEHLMKEFGQLKELPNEDAYQHLHGFLAQFPLPQHLFDEFMAAKKKYHQALLSLKQLKLLHLLDAHREILNEQLDYQQRLNSFQKFLHGFHLFNTMNDGTKKNSLNKKPTTNSKNHFTQHLEHLIDALHQKEVAFHAIQQQMIQHVETVLHEKEAKMEKDTKLFLQQFKQYLLENHLDKKMKVWHELVEYIKHQSSIFQSGLMSKP